MSTEKTTGKRAHLVGDLRLSGGDDLERFRHLCYELLQYSAKGLLRKDFLPKVSEKIKEHSGCDAVELWVKEAPDKHFRCSVTESKKTPFGFILVPCALGEETTLPPADACELGMERLCCDVIKGALVDLRPQVTEGGSFWTGDKPSASGDESTERTPLHRTLNLPAPYKDIVMIPIRLDEECIGLLLLRSRNKDFFSIDDVRFYEDISAVLGVALSHQYAQAELRERIKELTCLYGIARVIAQPEVSFDEIIQGIVELLPPAWLYPEITCARIELNGQSYQNQGFRESLYRQVADVVVNNEKIGFVEVSYLEKRMTLDEGPFLAEERSLIDNVAREVAIFYERAKSEDEKTSLQDQLRHADRLATIGQLAAGVAHELNEPLGNILGFAQLAKKSTGLSPEVERDLKNIEAASLNAREIIKKLMTFARQLPPQKMLVNLNDVVNDGLYFFEARCVKAGVQLDRRLASDLPKVTVDPGQINQVLVNLVVNAIQAMPEGGTLTVVTWATDEYVCFRVEDTGAGMTEKVSDKIFLPFFTTKDIDEGTGLGLAVVHGIVTSHGGKILIESEPGIGTNFQIRLPLTIPRRAGEKQA
jgi:signal transduction histidine kinase